MPIEVDGCYADVSAQVHVGTRNRDSPALFRPLLSGAAPLGKLVRREPACRLACGADDVDFASPTLATAHGALIGLSGGGLRRLPRRVLPGVHPA